MKHTAVVLASVLLAALVAVGAAAVEPERADAATSVKSCTGDTVRLSTKEKRMLSLHNRKRADKGLRRLCIHPKLQKAARAHSKDMIQRDYFSHDTKGRNESACERVRRYGYKWRACAENIAWGAGAAGGAKEIFKIDNPNIKGPDNWMDSKRHRSNILSSKYREVGIGAYKGNYGGLDNVTMWTVDFGTR